MNGGKEFDFGLADITIKAPNGEEIKFEAQGDSIDIEPLSNGIETVEFGFQKSVEITGTFEVVGEGRTEITKMIEEMADRQRAAIDELLSEIVADFGITEDDKKGARIETIIGAPAGDYSKVYVEGDLVAVYEPYKYPLKYTKFY